MKLRTLGILLAAGAVVAVAGAFLWPTPIDAWGSVCDNCMEGMNPQTNQQDAQCCLSGWHCDMLAQDGYRPILTNVDWCTTSWNGALWQCNGGGYCSPGGGSGGGGNCHIPYGDGCPAECMSCTYYYY